MDPTTGPFSWLQKILGANQQGGGSPFGALGGTGPTGNAVPPGIMGPPAPGTPNGAMPMSGLGPGPSPGAPLNLTPGPQQTANQQQQNPAGNNFGLWQAMQLMKPQQLQPAPWMQMMPMGTMRG
jgi:hypothetical protein